MTNLNRPVRLNRTLLAIGGVLLLAAGGFLLATRFGWLTVVDRDAPVVAGTGRPPTWVLYVVAGAAVVVALLALRWLFAQVVRAPKTRVWQLAEDTGGGRTELASTAAAAPLADEIAGYDGVHAAHAALTGELTEPALALVVSVEQGGDLTAIRDRIETDGLPRLRQALDLDEVPVSIEFRFSAKSAARVH